MKKRRPTPADLKAMGARPGLLGACYGSGVKWEQLTRLTPDGSLRACARRKAGVSPTMKEVHSVPL